MLNEAFDSGLETQSTQLNSSTVVENSRHSSSGSDNIPPMKPGVEVPIPEVIPVEKMHDKCGDAAPSTEKAVEKEGGYDNEAFAKDDQEVTAVKEMKGLETP
jgi:hypothetical protein